MVLFTYTHAITAIYRSTVKVHMSVFSQAKQKSHYDNVIVIKTNRQTKRYVNMCACFKKLSILDLTGFFGKHVISLTTEPKHTCRNMFFKNCFY